MSDSTTSGIDRVFDLIDNVVDKADRVLNRTKYTEEQHQVRRASRAEVDAAPSVKAKEAPASTALASRRRFYIVEAIAAESGQTIYVVTDGAHARAECTTLELAQQILRMLTEAPP